VLGLAESDALPAHDNISSTVRFAGDLAGSMSVTVPNPYARSLASSFLGITEAEVSPLITRQFVSELTNMICGCVLTGLDSQGAFQLFAPGMETASASSRPNQISPAAAAPGKPADDRGAGESAGTHCMRVLDTGDGVIAVGLQLEADR